VNSFEITNRDPDEPVALEDLHTFGRGRCSSPDRQHAQIKIILNNKRSRRRMCEKRMTGRQSLHWSADTPDNTEVFQLVKGQQPKPYRWARKISIKNCERISGHSQ